MAPGSQRTFSTRPLLSLKFAIYLYHEFQIYNGSYLDYLCERPCNVETLAQDSKPMNIALGWQVTIVKLPKGLISLARHNSGLKCQVQNSSMAVQKTRRHRIATGVTRKNKIAAFYPRRTSRLAASNSRRMSPLAYRRSRH